jgi:hypothetical protein
MLENSATGASPHVSYVVFLPSLGAPELERVLLSGFRMLVHEDVTRILVKLVECGTPGSVSRIECPTQFEDLDQQHVLDAV